MKFKKINLYTQSLDAEKEFYTDTLGFQLIQSSSTSFTTKVGWTEITFKQSDQLYHYHYCFLIPSNHLNEALAWMEKRTDVIEIEPGRKIQHFDSWNADSFYFYDASGNLAEFIVRYDLENGGPEIFQCSSVIGLNEIGMPTSDIKKSNRLLNEYLGTEFWKGDFERFGTNGDQEGLFLLPNYTIKNQWFPTKQKIELCPFEAEIVVKGIEHGIAYKAGEISKYTLGQ